MVSAKLLNIAAKTVGGTAIVLGLYDSHEAGKINASAHAKNCKAGSLSERYIDDLKLDSPSTIKAGIKKELFHYSMEENLSEFFSGIGGYCKGFGSMMVGNIVPFTLAAGTFIGGKSGKGIRGGISKCCGAGLLAYGGIFLLQEMFGIGKHK
jgi:hypothetical protein